MKANRILIALRTGTYRHHLQLLSEAPARLAEVYGSGRGIALARLLAGMVQVNDR